jgi:hypothetical protein
VHAEKAIAKHINKIRTHIGKSNKALEGATDATLGLFSINENLDRVFERNETLKAEALVA